jgi:hypothetical protein
VKRRVAAVLALLLAWTFSAHADDVLYSVRFEPGADLTRLTARGAVVRHVGNREAVVQGDPEVGAEFERIGVDHERLDGPVKGEDVYLCYHRSSLQSLSALGRVIWSEPNGAVLVAAPPGRIDALRAVCFHARPLPASIDATSWFDDRPPRHVSARAAAGEKAVRGLVEDVLAAVSTDSLTAHVDRLSRYAGGGSRSRYVLRDECLSESKPYIERCLEAYLPTGAVTDTQRFSILSYSCEDDTLVVAYPADNIVGILPGSGRLGGYYIVCAHYDATASHSFSGNPMWWCENPAPGADDNATGVGVVLEAARVLSDVVFPFDVRFIFFSGEELGLLGSEAYADSVAAAGDTIYGVLNVDMVGYKPSVGTPDTCHIVTNPGTRWFANWIIGTAEEYSSHFDGFDISRIDSVLRYSDHAAFWDNGYDALFAIEHWNSQDRNPYYHTVGDTSGNVLETQLAGVGRLVAGSVARLADTESLINLAVFSEDVSFKPRSPDIGEHVDVSVKVHVFGPDEHVDMRLEVWDGSPEAGSLLSLSEVARTMGGGEVIRHEFPWDVVGSDLGEHDITVRVIAEGTTELTESDNEAVAVVRISDPDDLFVMRHFAYPNPGAPEELNLRYELSRDAAAVHVEIFDLTGQPLGEFIRGIHSSDACTEAGWNTVALDGFGGLVARMASGVYVYRLRIYAEGVAEPEDMVIGKFAVIR